MLQGNILVITEIEIIKVTLLISCDLKNFWLILKKYK